MFRNSGKRLKKHRIEERTRERKQRGAMVGEEKKRHQMMQNLFGDQSEEEEEEEEEVESEHESNRQPSVRFFTFFFNLNSDVFD